jgi:hypothetical protein
MSHAAQLGELKSQQLRAAAQGNFENVFVVHALRGYFALPRNFVVLNLEAPPEAVIADLDLGNASPTTGGRIYIGGFASMKASTGRDVYAFHKLPAAPSRTERSNGVTVDYFMMPRGQQQQAVMIHDRDRYFLMMGSVVAVAAEILDTYVALTGPPDIFSPEWRNSVKHIGIPARNARPAADPLRNSKVTYACEARIVKYESATINSSGTKWLVEISSGLDRETFRRLGLLDGDVVVGIDGAALSTEDAVYRGLRRAVEGQGVVFSINRRGIVVSVVLDDSAIRLLGIKCKVSQ